MKIRKLTAFFLVLAMLAVPVLSLAESTTLSILNMAMDAGRSAKITVTFEPGAMLTQDQSLTPIADLLEVSRLEAGIQNYVNGTQTQVELFLQDKSSITFTDQTENDVDRFTSNVYGDMVISYTPEERMQATITQMEAQGTDEAILNTLKAFKELYAPLIKGELPELIKFDEKSLQEDLVSPATAWFTKLVSEPKVTAGTYESEKHDAATVQMVYSLSAVQIADLLKIAGNWAAKDGNLDTILNYISNFSPDTEDLTGSKADIQARLKALSGYFLIGAAPYIPEPFTATVWMNEQGDMVALELKMNFYGEDKTKPQDTILGGYYVKTEKDSVNNEFTLDITSGTDALAVKVSTKDSASCDEQWQATLDAKQMGMDAFGIKLDFAGIQETEGTGIKDYWKLNVQVSNFGQVQGILLDNTMTTVPSGADIKSDGKLQVYLTGQNAPVASALYSITTGKPVEIIDLSKNNVYPGKMTVDEYKAWDEEKRTITMNLLPQIIQNLPASVVNAINGTTSY